MPLTSALHPLQGRCLPRAPQRTSPGSSINTTRTHAERQKGIFDREAELEQLNILQRTWPAGVIVVLGPQSGGKTAVLQERFVKQADAVYVNCRTSDTTTPEGLIEVLLSKLAAKVPVDLQSNAEAALQKVPGVLAGLLSSMKITEKDAALTTVSITVSDLVKAFLGSKERQKNLNAVYDALR
jgi:AAA+ ATPase superfamily predicted ATPase